MTSKEDKKAALAEAMEHLAEAERVIRWVGDANLNAYAADQINATGTVMGQQVYQVVEKALKELQQGACPECGTEGRSEEVRPGLYACAECDHEWRA